MTVAVTANADTTVTVQQGDTVSKIANEHNTTVNAIVEKNHLANSNLIYVGEQLTIPDGNDSTTGNNKGGANTMTTSSQQSTSLSNSNTNNGQSNQTSGGNILVLNNSTNGSRQSSVANAAATSDSSASSTGTTSNNTAAGNSSVTANSNVTNSASSGNSKTATTINYSYVAYPQTNAYATGTTGSLTGSADSTANIAAADYTANNASTTVSANATYSPSQAISRAEAQLGTPYVYGGNNPSTGFDCSGLVQYAYGLSSNYRTTYQQQALGTHHYDVENAQAGDIYFWGTDTAPYHEALATGNGNYVVAPTTGETVQNSNINYYRPSYYVSMN